MCNSLDFDFVLYGIFWVLFIDWNFRFHFELIFAWLETFFATIDEQIWNILTIKKLRFFFLLYLTEMTCDYYYYYLADWFLINNYFAFENLNFIGWNHFFEFMFSYLFLLAQKTFFFSTSGINYLKNDVKKNR